MQKIKGLIAAPFTPLHENGDVNYAKIPEYCQLLEKNGIVGAFINGSTGEGVSLTSKEKMKITEEWVKCAKKEGKVKIINLVGGTSLRDCIESAQHSAENGVDAIALVAPYYFKPGVPQLVEFCRLVAESVPQLPVYFYHIPVLTGCYVNMIDFLTLADTCIPNLAGIKFTHEDFMDFLSCIHFKDEKYDMLWGRDECLLSALVLGAKGGVGSTYNYAAPLYNQLIGAYEKGDIQQARALQQQSIDMIRLLGKYGGIATGKAFMKYIGLDCGYFRPPVKNMEKESFSAFAADVKSLEMGSMFSTL